LRSWRPTEAAVPESAISTNPAHVVLPDAVRQAVRGPAVRASLVAAAP
jgi:hypothetical protein